MLLRIIPLSILYEVAFAVPAMNIRNDPACLWSLTNFSRSCTVGRCEFSYTIDLGDSVQQICTLTQVAEGDGVPLTVSFPSPIACNENNEDSDIMNSWGCDTTDPDPNRQFCVLTVDSKYIAKQAYFGVNGVATSPIIAGETLICGAGQPCDEKNPGCGNQELE